MSDILQQIENVLGSPEYSNEFGLIYTMRCEEALAKLLESNIQIDATITSPPYNIGKEYEKVMPVNEFTDWLVSICDQIHDLTKPSGSFLLNVGYLKVDGKGKAVPITYLLWERVKFFLQQEIVWNYGAGVAARKFLSPRNEKVLWYIKDEHDYTFNLDEIRDPDVKYPNQKKNGKLRCNTLGKNPSDVWQIAKVTSGKNRSSVERTNHPAQFPEDLITRMVKGFTNPGDIILDPFIGSGTTASTAIKNDRLFLGFEINPKYIPTIVNRLEVTLKELEIEKATLKLF
jgi:adenine-specific DNA-methyltransferase